MRKLIVFLFIITSVPVFARQENTKNLVIITLDGYRWKELFTGADEALIHTKAFISQKNIKEKYWRDNAEERRKALMPFFWQVIAKKGQLYGNRTSGNFFK